MGVAGSTPVVGRGRGTDAARIGGDIVQLGVNGATLLIDDVAYDLAPGASVALSGGIVHRADDGTGAKLYAVSDAHGNGFTASLHGQFVNVTPFVAVSETGKVQGLLGNFDGNSANDIALSDGTVLIAPVQTADLYGSFPNGWFVCP